MRILAASCRDWFALSDNQKSTMHAMDIALELAPITADEKRELRRLEKVVAKGSLWFVEVGAALREIRDRRLYRDGWETFEQYCEDRHDMPRQRAYQLIDAWEVRKDLSTVVDIPLPSNERQCRELVPVPSDERCEVWSQICESAQELGVPITAKLIREKTASYRSESDSPSEWEITRAMRTLGDAVRRVESDWPTEHRELLGNQLVNLGNEILEYGELR